MSVRRKLIKRSQLEMPRQVIFWMQTIRNCEMNGRLEKFTFKERRISSIYPILVTCVK
jgi:hypothetical protein